MDGTQLDGDDAENALQEGIVLKCSRADGKAVILSRLQGSTCAFLLLEGARAEPGIACTV